MNNLIRFIQRNQFLLLFLLLESFSLWLLANHNYYQRAVIGNFTRSITGNVHSKVETAKVYLYLASINQTLVRENVALRNELARATVKLEESHLCNTDTTFKPGYTLQPAWVVNNTINRQHNFLTLNVGRNHGVIPEMGVITQDGVVGIVVGVSDNYSTAISLLNIEMKLSARLKRTNYFGSFFWDGRNHRQAILTDIPQHVALNKGDTIVTSGFSAIFPPDIVLGTIEAFDTRHGNFYSIRVNLTADFAKLNHVWVVKDHSTPERQQLENPSYND